MPLKMTPGVIGETVVIPYPVDNAHLLEALIERFPGESIVAVSIEDNVVKMHCEYVQLDPAPEGGLNE